MKPHPSTAAAWTERYEALRRHVFNHRQNLGADPLGLVLVLRQGVAAWMRSWDEASSPATSPPCSWPPGPPLSSATPDWQQQLTNLLTQMTFAHLPAASLV
jgi:hypothetical protein